MLPHLDETIVALSSAAGPGGRAIVRLSGPQALTVVAPIFSEEIDPQQRRCHAVELRLSGLSATLPVDLYFWPAPRTYTGQNLIELHTLGCPPLVDLLIAELLRRGARAAQPGEFTLRAFLAGKLDLAQAEAVLGVLEAGSHTELKQALSQLAGGVSRPLESLRDDLLNLLADLEAGLDFAEEDIHFIKQEELLKQLSKGMAQLTLLQRQLDQRSLSQRRFRAVLAGLPNVGKSSLFNALTGGTALVAPVSGTTRDYLVQSIELDGLTLELIDTAGWQCDTADIEAQAQLLARQQTDQADLVLLCHEAGSDWTPGERDLLSRAQPETIAVATKCDLADSSSAPLATSTVTGSGLAELRQLLADRARAQAQPALAPSLSRCHGHVSACLDYLRRGHQMVLFEDPPELLAVEVRGALDQLGELVGAVYTDDLLDRIFSRFCIGK